MALRNLFAIFLYAALMGLGKTGIKTVLGSLSGLAALSASVPAMADVLDRPFFKADSIVIVFGADDFIENGGTGPIAVDFLLLDSASGTEATDLIAADGRTINYNSQRYNAIHSGDNSGWEFQVNDPTFGGQFNSSPSHQTLDQDDSYNAFGLDDDTDIDLLGAGNRASRFFVTSNSAFDIFAHATNLQTSGDFSSLDYSNIRYRLRYQVSGGGGVNRWGQNAQDPAVGGAGIVVGTGAFLLTLLGLDTLDQLSAAPVKVFDGGRRTAASRGSIMSQAVSFQTRYSLRGAGTNGNNYDMSQGVGSISADITYTVYTP